MRTQINWSKPLKVLIAILTATAGSLGFVLFCKTANLVCFQRLQRWADSSSLLSDKKYRGGIIHLDIFVRVAGLDGVPL